MAKFIVSKIAKPAPWLIEVAASIGLDYSALIHEITDHFVNHVLNRHGNPATHGAATVTEADFAMIPSIVKSPDLAIVGADRDGLCNVYVKIENDMTWLYFDNVLDSKRNRVLRGATLYKVTRPLTLAEILHNVAGNGKTDVSKAKILERA